MNTSYYTKIIVGQRVALVDLFDVEQGNKSCAHPAKDDDVYCTMCDKKIVRGAVKYTPKLRVRSWFGDDVIDADEMSDAVHSPVEDVKSKSSTLRRTHDDAEDIVLGIYLCNIRAPDTVGDKYKPGGLDQDVINAAFLKVCSAVNDLGLAPKVQLFVAPYVSY